MKLSDFVVRYFAETLGIRHVFLVVGGANMHLVDSVSRHPKMSYVCVQHEQAGAIAAESYARAKNQLGLTLVTSGPGGTNALTGLCCSWMDSVPVIYISGQVSRRDYTEGKTIRQLGVQQINIIEMVKSVTKYAAYVDDPQMIRLHLEKAVHLAQSGRPGPVWLDIPQDVQMADIDPGSLQGFSPEETPETSPEWMARLPEIIRHLETSQRPVLIVGNGVRLARAEKELDDLIRKLQFPVIATWNAIDLVEFNHPLYVGRSGVFGQYGANFAVANADLILSVGSRLDSRQTGTRRKSFAREAKKIVVDVSLHELEKGLMDIDVPVCADAKNFLARLLKNLKPLDGRKTEEWRRRCGDWKARYPVTKPDFFLQKERVNSYVLVDVLSDELEADDIVVTDMGTSLSCTMQAFKTRKGQRLYTNTGFAPMGYGLPAAVGAWFASGKKRIICLAGDGGLQMNIQELQTVAHYKIPVKLFILNNEEYATILHTQEAYFQSRFTASNPTSGYSAPDFINVARAYGLKTEVISSHEGLKDKIRAVLSAPGGIVCEVKMAHQQPLEPILLQHKRPDGTIVTDPIERLSPYLPEAEFKENMIVQPLKD